MKRYIVCDCYSDYKEVLNWNDLINLLLEDLRRDTMENIEDKNIVKNNYDVLEKIAKGNFGYDYLKEQLKSYGWHIQDLGNFLDDLHNFQSYKHGVGCPCIPNDCIEQTIQMVESEMNK